MARKITPNCVLEPPVRTAAADERALASLLDAARLPRRLALKRRERERRLTAERERRDGGGRQSRSCFLFVGMPARKVEGRPRVRGDHPL